MMEPPISNNYEHILKKLSTIRIEPYKKVSIVIPFYKNSTVLYRTLASISRQTYPRDLMEILICEDGSKEKIENQARLILGNIKLTRIWISRRGYRLSSVRNRGILCSTGDVILLVDFDILVNSDFVESHMKWHHISPNLVTFGLRNFVDSTGISVEDIKLGKVNLMKLPIIRSISNNLLSIDKRIDELTFIRRHPFPCNLGHGFNLGFSRSIAVSVGLFDESFNGCSNYEDIEFCYRMYQSGCYIVYVEEALVFHQENDVIDYKTKQINMEINREKLYQKVPGLREFRENFKVKRNF